MLTSLDVRDGDTVRLGQRLAVVRVESPNAAGAVGSARDLLSIAKQTAFASQQVALTGEKARSEAARLDDVAAGLRDQTSLLEGQVSIQREVVRSLASTFEQVGPVVERGFISKIEYERRRQALLGAREDLNRLQQQIAANRAEILKTGDERSQAVLVGANDQASARSTLEVLGQQRTKAEGESSYSIEAPVTGRVTTVQASPGRTVDPSVPLMVIIPEGEPLRADLFVTSRAIGFVRRGQEVRLLYDAFPYQRFGSYVAHIDTISRLAIAGAETGAPFLIKEPVYRVTATLAEQRVDARGEAVTLQPGMTLAADIVLERQSFLDWFLDPLRSVGRRH